MDFHITSQITCLRRLATDLERLEAGGIFAPVLMASPVLENWHHGFRKVCCVEGVVEGHPSLPDGRVISTSEIWAHFHDEDEHFVRTLNRLYRLGARGSAGHTASAELLSFWGRRG